eukprot:jgi/Hompol1/872/HPOL_004035-RA
MPIPVTNTPVPKHIVLHSDGAAKRFHDLLGCGVRQVTFLSISVYTAAIYIDESIRKRISESSRWNQEFDAEKLTKVGHPEGKWFVRDLAEWEGEISVRVDPVRNTDGPHLRNGFVRFLTARLREEEASMSEQERKSFMYALDSFRQKFPAGTVRTGQSLIFTRTADTKSIRVEFDGIETGVVTNVHLARWVIEGYLRSEPSICPTLLKSVASGIKDIIDSSKNQ